MRTIMALLLACVCMSAVAGEKLNDSQQYVLDFYNLLRLPKSDVSFLDDYAKVIDKVGENLRRADFKKVDALVMQLVEKINTGANPVPYFDLIARSLNDHNRHAVPDGYDGMLGDYETRDQLQRYLMDKCDELAKANDDAALLKCVKAYAVLQICEIRFRWTGFAPLSRSEAKKYLLRKNPDVLKAAWNEIDAQDKFNDDFYTKESVFFNAADTFAAKRGEPIPDDQFDTALAEMKKFWPPPASNPNIAFDVSEWLSHLASLTKARQRPDLLEKVNALSMKWSTETHDSALKDWLSATAKARAYDGVFVAHMAMGDDGEFIDQEVQEAMQARKKAAANPNAPPPPDPYAHFAVELDSADPTVRSKATVEIAKRLNSSNKSAVTEVCKRFGTEWGAKLVANKMNDEFLTLSKKAIALRPGNSESNEALLFLRVKVLMAIGAKDEALVEAKALYNFASLKNHDAATVLALDALAAARPGAADLNALRHVKVYAPEYEAAIEKATLGSYDKSESVGNLMLLLDQPKNAMKVFERAALLATAEQSTQALENIARARKALDFDPMPARNWLTKALATQPAVDKPPVKKKMTEDSAF